MRQRTFNLFTSLLLLCLATPLHAQSQQDKKEKQEDAITYPFYNGLSIGVDIFGPANELFGGSYKSGEINLDVNLKNTFIPTIELGYGTTDSWNDTGTHYKGSAPYGRIGVDYNVFRKKKSDYQLLFGLRYGFTSTTYDIEAKSVSDEVWKDQIENPGLVDDVWGGSIPYAMKDLSSSMHWFELVGRIKAKIYKSFYMGWAIRVKYRISPADGEFADPGYIPGYGKYDTVNYGLTYSLIYKLPF